MSTTQNFLFTALPQGKAPDGELLRLSVFVSPRLFPDGGRGTLSQFPDLTAWPTTVREITWTVQLDGVPYAATVATGLEAAPQTSLWETLLPTTTPVVSHTQPDYADRAVISYSTATALAQVRSIWQAAVATSPTTLPGDEQLLRTVAEATDVNLDWLNEALARIQQVRQPPERGPELAPPGDLDEEPGRLPLNAERGQILEILQQRYQQETEWLQQQAEAADEWRKYQEELEEHRRVVAALRADIDPEQLNQGRLRGLYAVRDFHNPAPKAASDAPHNPVSLPEQDLHRLLGLLGSHPAVLRRLGLIVDLEVAAPAGPHSTVRVVPQWTPKLAGAGPDMCPATRLDPTPGQFRAASSPGNLIEHGYLRLTEPDGTPRATPVVTDPDGAALATLGAVEGLVRRTLWREKGEHQGRDGLPTLRTAGFSLALDQRGARLADTFARARNLEAAGLGAAELTAEDFTRGYRVDVRDTTTGAETPWRSLTARQRRYSVGDLPDFTVAEEGYVQPVATGNGDAGNDPGGPLRIGESLFLWQGWSLAVPRPGTPINAADQVSAAGPEDGTGPLHLAHVSRAVPGSLPPLRFGRQYRFRLRAVDLTGGGPTLADQASPEAVTGDIRYTRFDPVRPPELLARTRRHCGETVDRLVVRSDYERLCEPEVSERHVVPPRAAQLLAEQHGLLDHDGRPDQAAYALLEQLEGGSYADQPEAHPDPEFPGAYYLNADHLPMAYLPDPLARAATLHGLPGTPGTLRIPLAPTTGESWPHLRPFRMELREGPKGARWYAHERLLMIWLPKAERAEVDLSCGLEQADLDLLGVWEWLREAGLATPRLTRAALRGQVWALTPPRRLSLVHAVRRPLRQPHITQLVPVRSAGESSCELAGQLSFSRKSTGQVDLVARWTEHVDPGQGNVQAAEGGPEKVADPYVRKCEATLTLPLDHGPQRSGRLYFNPRQDFADTRHRHISYHAVGTTAFREYFAPDDPGPYIRRSPELAVDIPASARPTAPKLLYAVPTFGWDADGDLAAVGETRSVRHGLGLRLYLDRPWYTSGDGELLGVLLAPPELALDSDVAAFTSQWGTDPVQFSRPLPADRPAPEHFRSALQVGTGLRLEELPYRRLTVTGHEVAFDVERKLWYCDILIDPLPGGKAEEQAYHPFVRLALARWQPSAVALHELSRSVTADFLQLPPNRVATVVRGADGASVRVTLAGAASPEPQQRQQVRVWVELRAAGIPDPDLGWTRATEPIELLWDGRAWTGDAPLPVDYRPGAARIVLEEAEIHPPHEEGRLVHLDILPL
ncbi:hypothetical protein PV341_33800 [Streptomyces sp. PA03-1a]|nr:hypothetical protein [Streptomyces sp. PA03-1a]